MDEDIVFEKTGFSIKYWGRLSNSQFIEEAMGGQIFREYAEGDRLQMFQIVYRLINDATRTTKEAPKV